ncbi:MAG: hypothetical protein UU95_C0004G0001 [Parcubacteria group bacterium GW2011_GWC2_42_12]|uniref:Uncharacterized protein n=1 Tax=Candidatus Falkowbacteria bacterium GW2011_GWA2_41_14 TaxID=1618635 RepID=A0A0G0USE3_9BACT|nr:MAG: hypothetical protein UU43_C0003G0001 [Candidatus Falkowbacteria bacterium GW2011_GWA2_41_14]KKS35118.1 MAG: hypothetical protein UU95_C0004G0001 [Parcubacteria group bacterium GW2011_GWC2_42_12]
MFSGDLWDFGQLCLGMDAGPEITICQELVKYDAGAVVVTEEIGSRGMQFSDSFRPNDPQTFRTVFISDPTDRSNQLKAFLAEYPRYMKIGKILGDSEAVARWEEKYSKPASITGATSAISCVRRGLPIFSVIVNYITQQLVVSCAAGNRVLNLPWERPELVDLKYVRAKGTIATFPDIETENGNMQSFVTFLGDVGKVGYGENFRDSNLISRKNAKKFLHYGVPGGPSRILYLSSLQPRRTPIGFILANGEKIGEWIHWLSFVRFAKSHTDDSQPALMLYEIFQDRPWTKEGVLMSTPPNYSVFREYSGRMYIDTSWLLRMPNPSQLRSTLIIAPHDNRWVARSSSQSGFRQLVF